MSQKVAKLIRKYAKVTMHKDLRPTGIKERPDYVIKQMLNKMSEPDRVIFIKKMRDTVKNDE